MTPPKPADRDEERPEAAEETSRRIGHRLEHGRRGRLDLHRDGSQHRRFTWLYDDLLS